MKIESREVIVASLKNVGNALTEKLTQLWRIFIPIFQLLQPIL